jgi:hypothetical protein
MDRQIVYPGCIPLDTDILNIERNVLVALGYLTQATLGTATIADGLACTPTSPASMSVSIGPGSITQFGVVDTTAFGSLPALSNDPLVRMGTNLGSTGFTLAAPTTQGQCINYLVQASLLEQDATPIVLPYYNAANPGQPYSGPGNNGAPQNTQRLQSVQLEMKAGPPVAIGAQNIPNVDAGWVGLYVITVEYGQTAITSSSIAVLPAAPFVTWKLPQLSPGTRNLVVFQPTTQGTWTVPAGVSVLKLRLWGGGGAGGSGFEGAGGGGAGGGYSEGFYSVSPGQSFVVSVGNGGAASNGGSSSFGSLAMATGGQAGASGGSGAGGAGGSGGTGSGSGLCITGSAGGAAFGAGGAWLSGAGGGAFGSAGAVPATGAATGSIAGVNATAPGAGGSGGIGIASGGDGGPGLVLVEW